MHNRRARISSFGASDHITSHDDLRTNLPGTAITLCASSGLMHRNEHLTRSVRHVDHEFEGGGLFDRKITGHCSIEYLIYECRGSSPRVGHIGVCGSSPPAPYPVSPESV